MRSVRTLFVLGSSLGLVIVLGCKKPAPVPEPPVVLNVVVANRANVVDAAFAVSAAWAA